MIEVMIATAVLLLGTVMIHESYLQAANLYGRYCDTLKVRLWMNDQIWTAKEALVYSPTPSTDAQSGIFTTSGKPFNWSQQVNIISGPQLYSIRMSVDWYEGNQPFNLTKEIYAYRKDPASLS